MNILEEIQNCSVEWKELGEVCSVKKGKQLNKNLLTEDGLYPAYNGGQTYSGRTNDYNVEANTIIVSQGGASAGFVNFVDTKFWANAHCYYILPDESRVNNRFVYHFVKMNQKFLMDFQHGAGIPALKADKLSKLLLPVPPLEIQEKIVQILDKFTDYVTELTSELTSRKKQYSFYRDKLLSFEDEVYQVEWKTLGEVGKVSMCRRILKNQTSDNGEVPFYKIGTFGKVATSYISRELFEDYKLRFSYPKLGDILISASGTIGRTVVFNGEDSYFQDSNIVWLDHDESQVLNRYLYYFYQMNPWKVSDGGTISRLYNGNIEKTRIPVPSLEIQSRIVQVLDNFDTVCHDLNIGLPKEIELRQKQYEYFREKLLTFVAEGEYTESRVEEWDNSAIIKLLQWVFGLIRVEFGAMATIVRGASPRPISKFITESEQGIPWIKIGDVEKDSKYVSKTKERITQAGSEKSRLVYKGNFIMSNSMSFGRPYILNIDDCIHDGWLSMNGFEDVCLPDYLYHFLLTDTMQYMMRKNASNGTVQNLNADIVRQLIIILPPLSIQSQVVSVLDKFDTLTNSLSEGLPKEIELRQKQYEYWRNRLLNFNE